MTRHLETYPQIDVRRNFIPEALTPLSFAPVYRELGAHHRLRYNQLQALCFNEQIVFFETVIGQPVMRALLNESWPVDFARRLAEFRDDELRHSEMFRRLNLSAAPGLYAGRDFHFIRAPRASLTLLRWAAGLPRFFALFIWLMLLQEERSLHYSREFIREKASLEPRFVATYRAHLIDEAGHVRCDEELLAACWPRMGKLHRQANAAMLAWMLGEFFSGPRRGQVNVIATLVSEHPELRELEHEMKRQLSALNHDRDYQLSLYSRRIAPRTFAQFDRWPELRALERVMPGYCATAGVTA